MADVGVWQPDVHGVGKCRAFAALVRAADSLDAPTFGLTPEGSSTLRR
jgi:hypothetical protein